MGKRKREREKSEVADTSSSAEEKKKKGHKSKKKKRRRSSPSSDSISSSASSSSERERKKRKKKSKKSKKKHKVIEAPTSDFVGPAVPSNLPSGSGVEETKPKLAPMTKAEWEKKQSVVKRVFDETTGRYRLIKGDGEVLEEIVSRDRHKEINKQATAGDGAYFQSKLPRR